MAAIGRRPFWSPSEGEVSMSFVRRFLVRASRIPATRQRDSQSRIRRLTAEPLESRLALTTVPVPIDAVVDESLATYLAQTQEMGPVAPPVTAPAVEAAIQLPLPAIPLDPAAVDLLVAAIPVEQAEAE